MLVLDQSLKIGSLNFKYVSEITVSSSLYEPVDVMTIKLPLKKGFNREDIKVKDKVVWFAGYSNYKLFTEFKGEVTEISPRTSENKPLEIVCKDMMFKAQTVTMDKNIYNKPLSEALEMITGKLPDVIPVEILPADIRSKKISSTCYGKSLRWVLSDLKRYGYFAFFRNNKLFCYSITELGEFPTPSVFRIGFNIIEDKLISRFESDIQVIVKSYNDKSGKVIEAKYPTKASGESKEFTVDGLSQSEVDKRAKDLFIEIAGTGLRGSFSTFGYPPVYHSDIIRIVDPLNKERNKDVFISKVVKTFSAEKAQFRQEIFPDIINFNQKYKGKKKK